MGVWAKKRTLKTGMEAAQATPRGEKKKESTGNAHTSGAFCEMTLTWVRGLGPDTPMELGKRLDWALCPVVPLCPG